MSAKVYTVTLEYKIIRRVKIFSNDELTPAEIEAQAKASDIDPAQAITRQTVLINRILASSECKVTNIETGSI